MSNIKRFTTNNATITIDSATKLQFNHNKCYKMERPYIFVAAYQCKDYALVHELQGFITDKVIKPNTSEELEEALRTCDNPFFLDVYGLLYEKIVIKDNKTLIAHYEKLDGKISESTYENEWLECFHVFKIDDKSWTEVALDLDELLKNDLTEWVYFANGMIKSK